MSGLSSVLFDVRHAFRLYLRTPVASAIAVLVIAVAMAAVATFLSLYNDLRFNSQSEFERGADIITVAMSDGVVFDEISLRLVDAINTEVDSLSTLAGSMYWDQTVVLDGEQTQLKIEFVTDRYFPDFRKRILLGRPLNAQDYSPDAEPAVVLSHNYWQRYFGGSPDAIGGVMRMSAINYGGGTQPRSSIGPERGYRVVGVMAPGVDGTFFADVQVWMPYQQARSVVFEDIPADAGIDTNDAFERGKMLFGLGRVAEGHTAASVAAELRVRFAEQDLDLGVVPSYGRLDTLPALSTQPQTWRELKRQVQLFLGGSVLLLLVAASNVSLFLLARAPARRRELSIRMAIGSSMTRLARQLATEAALVVVVSTVFGLVASFWLTNAIRGLPFFQSSLWLSASPLEWRVLGMTALLMLLLALIVSLVPIPGLRRLGIASTARSITTRAGPAQRVAGTAQIAIAGALGAAALAFSWHVIALVTADPGFTADDLFVIAPHLEPFDARTDVEPLILERERRREAIEAIPGVESVAFGTSVPGRDRMMGERRMLLPGRPAAFENTLAINIESVDHRFTEILDLNIIHGRALNPLNRGEILVNETLARAIGNPADVVGVAIDDRSTIVGVVENISFSHPEDAVSAEILSQAFVSARNEQILVKWPFSANQLRQRVQALIDAGELDFAIDSVDALEDLASAPMSGDRARMALIIVAAAFVVSLAGLGFYGTQRYLIDAGRREYAIRAALGADRRRIWRTVQMRALSLGLPGLVLATFLAWAIVVWLRREFIAPAVPAGAVAVLVAMGVAALVFTASLGPARHARNIQAAAVLRDE